MKKSAAELTASIGSPASPAAFADALGDRRP
jgi:hypothetical protein